VKLLPIGGFVGLAIGAILTIFYFYFSPAHFFAVNARMSNTNAKNQRVAENASANTQDVTVTDKRRGVGA
jgi:hypothetical protein